MKTYENDENDESDETIEIMNWIENYEIIEK